MKQEKSQEHNATFIEENKKAEKLIEAKEFPAAAKVLVSIVDSDPNNARAFNNMGIIAWNRGEWKEAFITFKHTCLLQPDYVDALINLFDASLKLNCVDAVLPILKKGQEMLPKQEDIQAVVAGIEEQGDQIYSSERALRVLKGCEAIETLKE